MYLQTCNISWSGPSLLPITVCNREGSIVAEYDLVFSEDPAVDSAYLEDVVTAYMEEYGCADMQDTCNITALGVIDLTNVTITGEGFDF